MGEDNRVEAILQKWRAEHPIGRIWIRERAQVELEFLDNLHLSFKKTANGAERESLARLEEGVRHWSYQLKPDLLERLGGFLERLFERGAARLLNVLEAGSGEDFARGLAPKWIPKELTPAARKEKEAHIASLVEALKYYGLSGRISEHGRTLLYYGSDSLQLIEKVGTGQSRASVTVQVERSTLTGRYYPAGYDMVIYRGLTPSRDEAAGVNVRDLDRRMAAIDWSLNYSNAAVGNSRQAGTNDLVLRTVNGVFRDLGSLLVSRDAEARRIHDQLAVKYFSETPNSQLVENFDDIKKGYEHKVHVDLSMDSPNSLSLTEALTVLNRGAITKAEVPGGLGQPWLSLVSDRDAQGFYQIGAIEGSEKFSLHASLAEAHVVGFPGFADEQAAMKALARGETVRASVVENDESVERLIYANPEKGKIAVDWIRTEEAALLHRDEQLTSTFSEYRLQQRSTTGIGADLGGSQGQGDSTTLSQQTTLFRSEPKATTADRTNLSSLERQLLEIGAPPVLAAEVLQKIKTSGEGEVSVSHTLEQEGNHVNAQLRFKRDPDLDWVRLYGYDVRVNFANGDQTVAQRFYYNSEDPVNSFSLSEAYNLAKGNPVARVVLDMEGQQKEVWKQLALNSPLTPAGNHHMTSSNYDLKGDLAAFPKRKDLERAMGANVRVDDLIERAKLGETVRFPANLDGTEETWVMRVIPAERRFEIVRSPESQTKLQDKQQGQREERVVGSRQERGETVPKR
jgi:hypothetical protein